jgi:putative transposase
LHLTLKREATKPAGDNLLRQQARFDTFMTRYNEERPHAALAMNTPRSSTHRRRASIGARRSSPTRFHDARSPSRTAAASVFGGKVNLSHALAGQNVGITQVDDRVWLVSFMECDLGYFDDETIRVEPIDNRFGARVLPMYSV